MGALASAGLAARERVTTISGKLLVFGFVATMQLLSNYFDLLLYFDAHILHYHWVNSYTADHVSLYAVLLVHYC